MIDKVILKGLRSVNRIRLIELLSNANKCYKIIKKNDFDYRIKFIDDRYRKIFDNVKNFFPQEQFEVWRKFIFILTTIDLRIKNNYTKNLLNEFLELYSSLNSDIKTSILKPVLPMIITLFNTNEYYEQSLVEDITSIFDEKETDKLYDNYGYFENIMYFIYKNNLFKRVLNVPDFFIGLLIYCNNKDSYFESFIKHYNYKEIYELLSKRKRIREVDIKLMKFIPMSEYELNENIPLCFFYNLDYFKYWILDKNYDINLINLYKGSDVDNEFAIKLIDRGYQLSSKSPYLFYNNIETLEHAIIDKKQDINIANYFSYDFSDKLSMYLFENNYDFKFRMEKCSENFCEFYYNEKFKNDRLDNFIKTKLSVYKPYYHLVCFLEVIGDITTYGVSDNEMLDILQYMYFSFGKDHGFQYIIVNNKVKEAIRIFKLIVDEWDIKKFVEFTSNYIRNEKVCNMVLENEQLLNKNNLRYKFMRLLVYGDIDIDLFTSIDDVINYNELKYEYNLEKINNGFIDEYKDIILSSLFNLTSSQAKIFIKQFHDSSNFNNLIKSIHSDEYKEVLQEYKLVLGFIASIVNCNDSEVLFNIVTYINNLYKNNKLEPLDKIWLLFKDMENDIRYILGEEINEKIIDLNEMLMTKSEDIPTDRRGRKLYNHEIIVLKKDISYSDTTIRKGENIDYIELTGIPFVLFGHVLNAFGGGGNISLFKKPYIGGKTHICLSAISDNHFLLAADQRKKDIDSIQLLFTNVPSEQFVMGSNKDINSSGYDLDIHSNGISNFNPIRYNISNTVLYNEYVYYRKGLYPSAVLISGNKPKEYEITAAAYLGIPLVKINKKRYPAISPSELFKKDDSLYDYYEDIYVKRRKKNLEKNIIEIKKIREFLQFIYSDFSDDKEVIK